MLSSASPQTSIDVSQAVPPPRIDKDLPPIRHWWYSVTELSPWLLLAVVAGLLLSRVRLISRYRLDQPRMDDPWWWLQFAMACALLALEKLSSVAAMEAEGRQNERSEQQRPPPVLMWILLVVVEISCYVIPLWFSDEVWYLAWVPLFSQKWPILFVERVLMCMKRGAVARSQKSVPLLRQ